MDVTGPDGLPAGGDTQTESLYRTVVATAPEPVLIVDAIGQVVGLNDAARALVGYSRREALGVDLAELLTADGRRDSQLYALRATYRRAPSNREGEFVVATADGTERPVALRVARLGRNGASWSAVHLRDLSPQRSAEADLRHRAMHDALTGLPGRDLFMDRLAQALGARREAPPLVGVLFLDLDGFKHINDTRGHGAGDSVLRLVATRASEVIRPEDTLARISGDEFTLLCPNLQGEDHAVVVAGRVQEAIERPVEVDGHVITPRVSVGAAVARAGSVSPEALLTQADSAMYVSKDSRRDTPVAFNSEMRDRLDRRSRTEFELRAALEDDGLELHYQPQVSLADGSLTGVEALVRWRHPERGLLLPAEFVPLAEQSGLIVDLGHVVLEQALRQVSRWAAGSGGVAPPVVAVNLSPAEFADPALPAVIDRALRRWGLEPETLCLEITERTVMTDAGATLHTLAALGGMGVRLAIDDFGTGYSSLSYLRLLPVDQLKVDASFVEGLARRRDDRAIVGAVVQMAHALGLVVVAEGIELPEHQTELDKLHCDIGQGYHFAHPLAADELDGYVAQAAARLASADSRV